MNTRTNKFIFILAIATLFILSGCSQKEQNPNLFIYQEGEEIDSSAPLAYGIFPEGNQLRVVWGNVSKSYDTDLLTFTFSDESIEMSYQDKEKETHTQTFTILSDSVVQDETGKNYQWFKDQEN